MPDLVSVVVRFTNYNSIDMLKNCLTSLRSQTYSPIQVVVVYSELADRPAVDLRSLSESWVFDIVTVNAPFSKDTRTIALNLGISSCRGQYLGFLDYDDLWYPNAVESMITRLNLTLSAVSVFGINLRQTLNGSVSLRPYNLRRMTLSDFADQNFIPIHSFLINRMITGALDTLPDALTRFEDYYLLLSIVARYSLDLEMQDTIVGEYCIRDDGTNSVVVGGEYSDSPVWHKAENFIRHFQRDLIKRFPDSELSKEIVVRHRHRKNWLIRFKTFVRRRIFALSPALGKFLVRGSKLFRC